MQLLLLRESMDLLVLQSDAFRLQSKGSGDQNVFDFDTFEKAFKKKTSLLMGLGSHKILDYLSISVNVPMFYHPHSIYSLKPYTKAMHDLITANIYD